jgi:hypothetical protein
MGRYGKGAPSGALADGYAPSRAMHKEQERHIGTLCLYARGYDFKRLFTLSERTRR